ncbi:hypothetical protein [Arthrobacter sp. A5]|uniref:hypothetical protein n=1 Tax=Arthrobacter sp. A5 TaxID=576926 RepID=UPI003DA7FE7F
MIQSWFSYVISALIGVAASLLIGQVHWIQPLLWAIAFEVVWVIINGFFVKGYFLSRERRQRLNRRRDNTPSVGSTSDGQQPEQQPADGASFGLSSAQPPAGSSYGFSNYGSSNVFYTDTETDSGYLNVGSNDIHYTRARHKGRPISDPDQQQ